MVSTPSAASVAFFSTSSLIPSASITCMKWRPTVAPRAGSEKAMRGAASSALFNWSGVDMSGCLLPGVTARPPTVAPTARVTPSLSRPPASAARRRSSVVTRKVAPGSATNFCSAAPAVSNTSTT